MPQMAPLWWTTLLMFFSTCFILIMMKSYFILSYKIDKKSSHKMKTNKNWKW
uniref:ATP synthase F0 subunit 8 n=1 Tax=Saldoida armata TaxID=2715442 RepID=UPI002E77E6F3|nr:ATP synthase F0 subunit 8 [Saldoida armata]WQB61740.1 ATP synthase F0 subunit 8 [Saldoida armata]